MNAIVRPMATMITALSPNSASPPARLDDVDAQEEHHRENRHDRQDALELAAQVAVRADADRVPDFLHLRRSLVLLHDDLRRNQAYTS